MAPLTRREFVKVGAKGVALASIPFIFKVDPLAAFTGPPAGSMNLTDYYAHFGVDESIVKQVMAAAMEKGGDYCDIFFGHDIFNMIVL